MTSIDTAGIDDMVPDDYPPCLALNNQAVPAVNSHESGSWLELISSADCALIARIDHHIAGMLIGFQPGKAYTSSNYLWLSERYSNFSYVDRIVVSPQHRGSGVGKRLYAEHERRASLRGNAVVLCEVNTDPPNPQSLAFHQKLGWQVIEERQIEAGKSVCYLQKLIAPPEHRSN